MAATYVEAARDDLHLETFGLSLPAIPHEPVRMPALAWLAPAIRARLEAISPRDIVAGVALPEGDPLLPPALELAGELGATLHLVYVFHPPASHLSSPLAAGTPNAVPPELYTQAQEERLSRCLPTDSRTDRVVCHAVEGVASECLEELVRETRADLLILGTSRPPAPSRRAVGSTAYQLIRALRIPVLVLGAPASKAAGNLRPATLFSGPAQLTSFPGVGSALDPAALTVNSRAGAAVHLRSVTLRSLSFPPEVLVPEDRRVRADYLTTRRSRVP